MRSQILIMLVCGGMGFMMAGFVRPKFQSVSPEEVHPALPGPEFWEPGLFPEEKEQQRKPASNGPSEREEGAPSPQEILRRLPTHLILAESEKREFDILSRLNGEFPSLLAGNISSERWRQWQLFLEAEEGRLIKEDVFRVGRGVYQIGDEQVTMKVVLKTVTSGESPCLAYQVFLKSDSNNFEDDNRCLSYEFLRRYGQSVFMDVRVPPEMSPIMGLSILFELPFQGTKNRFFVLPSENSASEEFTLTWEITPYLQFQDEE